MAKAKDVEVKKKKPAQAGRAGDSLEHRMERWFEDFFNRRWPRLPDWPALDTELQVKTPRVDVIDRDSELLVKAELPGMSREDIDLSVSDTSITVRGRSRREEKHDEDDYHRREIVSQFVSRTVPLPCEVDGDHARAQLRDGMLEVTLPKVEKARSKRIEVSS